MVLLGTDEFDMPMGMVTRGFLENSAWEGWE